MITLVAFLMASSLVLLVFTLVSGRNSRLDARLDDLAGRGDSHPEQDSMAAVRPHGAAQDGDRAGPDRRGGADAAEVPPHPRRAVRPAGHGRSSSA